MKDLSRNVKLYCDVCGNDQFLIIDDIDCELKDAQMKQKCNAQIVERFSQNPS